MSSPNISSQLLIALTRIDLAETMTDAAVAFVKFDWQTLAEYAVMRECYRSSIDRIDAHYRAQVAIRNAQLYDDKSDGQV